MKAHSAGTVGLNTKSHKKKKEIRKTGKQAWRII
jgi:hypothetical protein